MITEILREHDEGNGFTMKTQDPFSAFTMAHKMATSGIDYLINISKEPGQDWVVVVTEVTG